MPMWVVFIASHPLRAEKGSDFSGLLGTCELQPGALSASERPPDLHLRIGIRWPYSH